jgi:hypothetical protein
MTVVRKRRRKEYRQQPRRHYSLTIRRPDRYGIKRKKKRIL